MEIVLPLMETTIPIKPISDTKLRSSEVFEFCRHRMGIFYIANKWKFCVPWVWNVANNFHWTQNEINSPTSFTLNSNENEKNYWWSFSCITKRILAIHHTWKIYSKFDEVRHLMRSKATIKRLNWPGTRKRTIIFDVWHNICVYITLSWKFICMLKWLGILKIV